MTIRQSLRALRHSPAYSLTVAGVVALCVSLSTTVFAVVDGVLFKPLPYRNAGELYQMSGGYLTRAQKSGIVIAPRNIRDWTAAVPGAVSTVIRGSSGAASGDVRAWVPSTASVDAQFFDVLGLSPLVGGFTADDYRDASRTYSAALISYGVWQTRFGGRADIVGQTMAWPGEETGTLRIAGVLPKGFVYPSPNPSPELLVPIQLDPKRLDDLRYRQLTALVRLPQTEPFDTQQARMDAAAAAEAVDWVPRANDGSPMFDHVGLRPIETVLSGRQRPTFLFAFSAAGVLMLLGCLNISGLMTSRAIDRGRDISVRRALGGRPRDIAVFLLTENALVVGAGALIGALTATPLLRITLQLLPTSMGGIL